MRQKFERLSAWIHRHVAAVLAGSVLIVGTLGYFLRDLVGLVATDWYHRVVSPWLFAAPPTPRLMWVAPLALAVGLFIACLILLNEQRHLGLELKVKDQVIDDRNHTIESLEKTLQPAMLGRRVATAEHALRINEAHLDLAIALLNDLSVAVQKAGVADVVMPQQIVERLLTRAFNTIIALYKPEVSRMKAYGVSDDGNWLCVLSSKNVENRQLDESEWYIGPNASEPRYAQRTGSSSVAFKERTIKVIHIDSNKLAAKDDPTYKVLPSDIESGSIPYAAFVCLPILTEPNQPPLGVLTVDSSSLTTFDNVSDQTALKTIAALMGTIIRLAPHPVAMSA